MALAFDITSLDFQQARIKQVLFKSRLRSVLYGVREADSALFARADNPLGQWLDAVVKPKYGARPEVTQIDAQLQRLLDTGRDLVRLYQRGQIEEARAGLDQLNTHADRIDALLLALEREVV
ncbi:CZB domain-containing protein [Hymenobacter edaphi]|uniref:CZB domain-containing protein n=1 Tax=Hymenobacter edaphi TaxID=2211146 RepID=UPI0010577BE5|nr:CZB domain-containing protein [Hymenobacter edaphi]